MASHSGVGLQVEEFFQDLKGQLGMPDYVARSKEYRKRPMGPAGVQYANLRTTLLKIIPRTGKKPWPRP